MPEDEKKPAASDESRPTDIEGDDKHRVVHSDEITDVEDPRKVERAHKKLVVLVVIAVVGLIVAVFLLFVGLESTPEEVVMEEETPMSAVAPLDGESVYYSYYDSGVLVNEFHNIDTNTSVNEIYDLSNLVEYTHDFRNPTWQRSLDGLTVVYQEGTSAGITNNNNAKDNKIVAVVNSVPRELLGGAAVNEIADWVLASNGQKIYVAKTDQKYWGSSASERSFYTNGTLDLYVIDVTTGEENLLLENFNPKISGQEITPLHYAKNGSLHLVSFESNNRFSHWVYDLARDEYNTLTANFSAKLTGKGPIEVGSISVDGSQAVLISTNQLHLISLNSTTMRTFYQTPSGYQALYGTKIVWSPFTNRVAFTIAKSSRGEHKVQILETGKVNQRTLITNPPDIDPNPSNNHNVEVLAWSPEENYLSVLTGGQIYTIDLDSVEIQSVIKVPNNIKGDKHSAWILRDLEAEAQEKAAQEATLTE